MSSFVQSCTPPRTFTDRELTQLLRTTGDSAAGFRDHIVFSLALGTGLREHEVVALDVGDVFDAAGRARRRVPLRVFKRSNDDVDAQEVVLSARLRAKLERYFPWKRSRGEALEPGAPLFVSRKHRRLSTRQLRSSIAAWQKRAGLERRLSFHSIRHTACTNLYRQTKDIVLVQRFARHRSLLSTMRYTHTSLDELARGVAELLC